MHAIGEASRQKTVARQIKKAQVAALKSLRAGEEEAVARIKDLLKDLNKRLRSEMALLDGESFRGIHLAKIQAAVNAAVDDFQRRAEELMRFYTGRGLTLNRDYWNIAIGDLSKAGSAINIVPVLSDEILSVTAGMGIELIRNISQDMRSKIVTTLQRAVLGAKTPFETARQLSTIIGPRGTTGAGAAAERIVRTEINRAFNTADELFRQGAVDTRPENLPVLKKIWVSLDDARVRPAHQAMHKVVVDADDTFTVPIMKTVNGVAIRVGSEQMDNPLDPSASPGNTINCRCTTLTVPEDIVDETLSEIS